MDKEKDNKHNKKIKAIIAAIIAAIILLLIILMIVLISIFACKPKSKNTQQLEIVGQEELDGEINIAGQSNEYVAKSNGEVVEDCTWTLTSPISIITFNTNNHTINWADTILDGNYELVLNVKKDGFKTCNFNIMLKINLPMLYMVGQNKLQGSFGYANQSEPYSVTDSTNTNIIADSWNLSSTISGISFDASSHIISWDDNLHDDSYFLTLTVLKNEYETLNFDIELIIFDNYFEWNDGGTTKRENINMEIQKHDFFEQIAGSGGIHTFNYFVGSNLDTETFSSIINNATLITKIHFKFPEVIDENNFGSGFNKFMYAFCYQMNNLTDCTIIMPKTIPTIVGNDFMYAAFKDCTNLTKINDDFIIPSNYTCVGNNFMGELFIDCTSLKTLPYNFSLPNIDSNNIGNNFCQEMFKNCTSLTQTPNGRELIIPNLTGTIPNNFCKDMFTGCTNLDSNPIVPGDTRMIARNS